jgi:hypothetical protein
LSRIAPQLAQGLSRCGKRLVDLITGEAGNYTDPFVQVLQAGLSAGAGQTLPVRRFQWSSQNNHIARADGAIGLLDALATWATDSTLPEAARVQLWAHSHGGNVLALMTQLLGAEPAVRTDFFEAAQSFYQPWIRSSVDQPAWQRVRELLEDAAHPVRRLQLDLVTFGTPLRYGWHPAGYAQLLHFIHHRPPTQGKAYQAPVPLKLRRACTAQEGDYVQQVGIAGTNFMPLPWAPRTWLADRRLGKLLEADLAKEWLVTRLRHGARVPDAGQTLLVDYRSISRWPHRHLAGHALYTLRQWLPFHGQQIAQHFYGAHAQGAIA